MSFLPPEIGALTKLGTFDLHSNKVASQVYVFLKLRLSLNYILFSFQKCGRWLNVQFFFYMLIILFCMQLKDYPAEACKLQLSVLDLSNNSLSGLPSEIGKVSFLFSIDMSQA